MYLQTLEITWNYFPRTDSRERVDADPLGVKQPWTFFRPSGRLYIYTFSHGGACKWNFARGPSGRWCLPGSWETRACLHTYTRAAGRWRFLQFLFLSPFSRDERETLTAVDRSCGCRCTMKSEKVKSRRPDGKLKGSTNLYIYRRVTSDMCVFLRVVGYVFWFGPMNILKYLSFKSTDVSAVPCLRDLTL